MTEKVIKHIFDAKEQAGISMVDLSRLTGISRETLYRWKKGAKVTDRLRLNLAYTYSVRISKAVQLEQLPLKDKLKKDQRLKVYKDIIKNMASK